jgi:hypothetical protein
VDELSCLLHTGAHGLDSLAFHVAMLGVEFEVQEPGELKQRLSVLAGRLARAAQATSPAGRES